MSKSEGIKTGEFAAMSQDVAGAVNLFAHPMAGLAAMGAFGFGLAGHAFGLWAGGMAGAMEASRRAWGEQPQAETTRPTPAPLKLVVSRPAPAPKADVAKVARPRVGGAKASAKPKAEKAPARPAAAERPSAPDDLKAISGIGPKLEKVLNGLGLWTYGQIAALSETEIAWLDNELGFAGRIGRDDWTGQARALQSGSAGA